jgi:hypothetical protein
VIALAAVGLGTGLRQIPEAMPPSVAQFWSQAREYRRAAARDALSEALWEARGWRVLAQQAANRRQEALEAWDPRAMTGEQAERERLAILAHDPDGYLHGARTLLVQAALLVRTDRDAARVAELRAMVEHEAGDHQEELRQARRAVCLSRRSQGAQAMLRRARGFVGLGLQ